MDFNTLKQLIYSIIQQEKENGNNKETLQELESLYLDITEHNISIGELSYRVWDILKNT